FFSLSPFQRGEGRGEGQRHTQASNQLLPFTLTLSPRKSGEGGYGSSREAAVGGGAGQGGELVLAGRLDGLEVVGKQQLEACVLLHLLARDAGLQRQHLHLAGFVVEAKQGEVRHHAPQPALRQAGFSARLASPDPPR